MKMAVLVFFSPSWLNGRYRQINLPILPIQELHLANRQTNLFFYSNVSVTQSSFGPKPKTTANADRELIVDERVWLLCESISIILYLAIGSCLE